MFKIRFYICCLGYSSLNQDLLAVLDYDAFNSLTYLAAIQVIYIAIGNIISYRTYTGRIFNFSQIEVVKTGIVAVLTQVSEQYLHLAVTVAVGEYILYIGPIAVI